jgi:hypothetical protein
MITSRSEGNEIRVSNLQCQIHGRTLGCKNDHAQGGATMKRISRNCFNEARNSNSTNQRRFIKPSMCDEGAIDRGMSDPIRQMRKHVQELVMQSCWYCTWVHYPSIGQYSLLLFQQIVFVL